MAIPPVYVIRSTTTRTNPTLQTYKSQTDAERIAVACSTKYRKSFDIYQDGQIISFASNGTVYAAGI